MRIDELHLKAFGPFADRRLDFSHGAHGLHVVFGPNEAGKSSALRALRALFYGVDERTSDGFLCGNEQVRVGGRLTLADGRKIACVRRKGRKNTLLAAADNRTIDETLLVPFLSGVSSGVFSSMFGIDHQTLVEGGAEILQQNGDVGSTLFAAALGNRRLQTTLAELEGEASELYRPSGSKYAVNKAFAEFKEARREMKDEALAVKDWDAHRQSLEDLTRRLDTISEQLAALLSEKRAVERLARILPRVALRRTHLAAIDSLGPVVELPADFAERRRALLSKKTGAEEALAAGRRKRDMLAQEAATFAPPGRILDEERTVRALHQRLGSYRKSLDDRPAIEGKRQQARNDARDILKRLRPDLTLDDVPPLRPAIAAAKRPLQELATRHQSVETTERQARKALADKDHEIGSVQDALQAFPHAHEAGPLKRAVAEARRAGDLDSLRREAVRAEAKLDRQCRDELAALGLWHGALDALHALPVPGSETVARHVEVFRLAEERHRSLGDERRRTIGEIADGDRVLTGMRLAGTVPTERDLVQARLRRAEGWTLVKRAWLDHVDVTDAARTYDEARSLPEAYETTTTIADDIADRLRREADRVAAHALALARRDQLERDLADLDRQEAEQVAARQAIALAWTSAWSPSGITPQSPEEMRAWLTRLASLKERVLALSDRRAQTQALQETLAGHQRTLAVRISEAEAEPPVCGETLAPFLEQAEAIADGIDAIATRRKDLRRLTGDRAKIAGDLEHAITDLEAWKADWSAALRSLGQPADARPAHVQSLVDGYSELFTKLDEEDAHRRRVYGINQDIKEFEEEVRAFVRDVDPASEDAEIWRCVERLNDALKRATTDKTNRDAIEKQMRELALHLDDTDARLAIDRQGLAALCREARCEHAEALEEAERRSDALRSWRDKTLALDHEIVAAGDGASLEVLVAQAEETVVDDLPARTERVTERIRELESEREHLRETKGAEEHEMRRMTGVSASADAAAKAQDILASMRRHVETYLRTRVAALVLKKEVERYRDAHQDPVLVRGGAFFASLSCGSFATISSEIEDDEPRLVGIRSDGTSVPVGGMSSGTRDQLYLALRFATLERYLTSSEPMPFVVDDILINFDDGRALATLEVLAAFSAKTQVLLFTHHARIRDMAAALASPNGVFVQELP